MRRTPALLATCLVLLAACSAQPPAGGGTSPQPSTRPADPTAPPAAATAPTAAATAVPEPTAEPKVPTLADTPVQTGLALPWDVAFAPDGRMFVTERAGNILIFESGASGARRLATIAVPQVRAQGESGLMGIALDPDFARNGLLYVCASRTDQGEWRNQILRWKVSGESAELDGFVVRDGMRAATIHDGCRLVFGPDGRLWATMGESGSGTLAQDLGTLNGKVLRVNGDGTIPSDNPVLPGASAPSAIFSFGHRNPQGLAFEPGTGRPFLVDHGANSHDEINLLRAGANYGWPVQAGPGGADRGFVDPLWTSGAGTLATSGGAFVDGAQWGLWSGSLFVATLKEGDLRRFAVDGTTVTPAEVLLDRKYGRLRSVVPAADGSLYVTTSNGAGDRIIRISASQ